MENFDTIKKAFASLNFSTKIEIIIPEILYLHEIYQAVMLLPFFQICRNNNKFKCQHSCKDCESPNVINTNTFNARLKSVLVLDRSLTLELYW